MNLRDIPNYMLDLDKFNHEYPIYDNQKNSMTVVYDNDNTLFSLRISLTSDKKGLITDNYPCTRRTPINKLKKTIKAYLESQGYKVKLGIHR